MSLFSKLAGIIGTEFFLDSTGANVMKLVAGSGVLEVKDPSDNLISIAAANVNDGLLQYATISATFSDIGTPVNSTVTLPQNARVSEVRVIVGTLFSGGSNPVIEVGTQDTFDLFVASADVNLEQANTYKIEQWTAQPNASARAIRVTLGGTATAGAVTVVVGYVLAPNT
jgi:hypothetical protein